MFPKVNYYRVSDLLEQLKSLREDGYEYCEVFEVDGDTPDEVSFIQISVVSDGGQMSEECEEIEAVPYVEIIKNAWIPYDVEFYGDYLEELKAEMLAEYLEEEGNA